MGRYFAEGDMDDLESLLASGRWEGRFRSSLRGKRTKALLQEIERALLAMPEKRLTDQNLCDGQYTCVLGEAWAQRQVHTGAMTRDAALIYLTDLAQDEDAESGCDETVSIGMDLGLTREVAWHLAELNDDPWCYRDRETPEQRWRRILGVVRHLQAAYQPILNKKTHKRRKGKAHAEASTRPGDATAPAGVR
jgi:hypothetical protein